MPEVAFWCLIIASAKLMQYVYARHYFASKFTRNINYRYFNFLFEPQSGMYLSGSYLLPSFSLVVLGKIALI